LAHDVILYPSRNQLKKYSGGRDKLYPFMELFNTVDMVKFVDDDFVGKVDVTYKYGHIENGTSAAVTGTVASTNNGICRLTTGTDDAGYAAIFPNTDGSLEGAVVAGTLSPVLWVRLKTSAITTVKIEVGFTDSDADAGAALVLATPTATADNCAIWCFDTNDTGNATQWQGFTVAAAGTPAKVEPTLAVAAATYEWLGVAIQGQNVKFMHMDANGNPNYESAWQPAAITAATALVPWVFAQTRAGSASRTIDIDYWLGYQRRTADDQ
jgi:hypothetical protein